MHILEWVPPSEWRIDYSKWIADTQRLLTPQMRAEIDRALAAKLERAFLDGASVTGLLRKEAK